MQHSQQDEQTVPQRRHFGVEEGIFILMVVLSMLGIITTDFSPADGYGYWLLMVLVFAMLAILVSWLQAKKSEELDFGEIIKQQGLHWFHTLVIVGAATLVNHSGQLTEIAANLVILLILALATLLDGFRIGWQFSVLGFFLAGCAIIIAYIDSFIAACASLAAVMVVGTLLWSFWRYRHGTTHEN
ncbi:MAG: hypothetical protein ACXV7J_01835 [Methylomonas sp.]